MNAQSAIASGIYHGMYCPHKVQAFEDRLCKMWHMTASGNHHYFSEVDRWFYEYLAGMIAPVFVDGITWVRSRHRDISVYYDEDKLVITVSQPAVLTLGSRKIPLHEGMNEISRK